VAKLAALILTSAFAVIVAASMILDLRRPSGTPESCTLHEKLARATTKLARYELQAEIDRRLINIIDLESLDSQAGVLGPPLIDCPKCDRRADRVLIALMWRDRRR
jgi:hypothetical protein